MTHPEGEVGGQDAPEPTVEDRLNAAFGDPIEIEQEEEEAGEPEAEAPEEEAEAEEEGEPEAEAEDSEDEELEVEDEEPEPIEPPNSLTAEEKEAFKKLSREAQEFTLRRITDAEKGIQTKAQEAAQAKRQAQQEAMQQVAEIRHQQAEELQRYAQLLLVPKPTAALHRQNPQAYFEQLEAHEQSLAQVQRVQQDAQKAQAERDQYIQALEQQDAQAFRETLQTEYPEFLDDQNGPKVRQELTATAKELGYPDDLINNANATDILALRKVAELKAKADKYDRAMAKKMEGVRAAKNKKLPKVSKPGSPKAPGTAARKQFEADRAAARRGDVDAQVRLVGNLLEPK